jgi:hypothetical protein
VPDTVENDQPTLPQLARQRLNRGDRARVGVAVNEQHGDVERA